MRARVLITAVAVLPLLGVAACGGGAHPVTTSTGSGGLGCGGWYVVSHDVLTAELQLNGPVRAVAVNAVLDDGSRRGTPSTLQVRPGSSYRTVHVRGVGSAVLSATARVIGATAADQATCALSNPH